MAKIKTDYPPCENCPLRGPKATSKGDPASHLVFVAESPGRDEVQAGIPLVGPSGQVFHQIVPEDKDYYILNAMNCFPSPTIKKRLGEKITDQCSRVCHDRVMSEVRAHPRKLIVAMGNSALRSLTGDYSLKITQARGGLIESDLAELGIFPVLHVAAVMKGTGSLKQWTEDMQYALHLGEGGEKKQHLAAKTHFVVGVNGQEPTRDWLDNLFYGGDESNVKFMKPRKVTGDIETSDLHYMRGRILTFGVTFDDDPSVSYCFFPHQFHLLKPYLEDLRLQWAWHNGGFDVKWFRYHYNIDARIDDDTMLMSYCLDESAGVHGLETVSGNLLGAPDYKDMLKPYLPSKKTSYENVPLPILGKYQGIDTSNTSQIRTIMREQVKQDDKLDHLYEKILMPASEMLAQTEMNGFYVDQDRIKENETYYLARHSESQAELDGIAGRSFAAGSPQQVAEIMFDMLKFPMLKKRSTDKEVIAKLRERIGDHPFLIGLSKHRDAVKQYGTYVKGMSKHIQEDGRIHPSFLIHGTRTGRLSCRDPNLMNIPRLARMKGQFVASPGHYLLDIDLAQAELRVLACASNDPNLVSAFKEGRDVHMDLCLDLWGDEWDSYDKVTKKEKRVRAKNVAFGTVYGITAAGLSDQINDTRQAAQELLDGWNRRYSVARAFLNKCRDVAGTNKVMTTSFGRKKRPVVVTRENRHFVQNECANFPMQSMASDINLLAAVRTWRRLYKMGVRIVNLVHDSIIMEVPETVSYMQAEIIELVQTEMARVPQDYGLTQIPFESDAEVGTRWGNLEELPRAA